MRCNAPHWQGVVERSVARALLRIVLCGKGRALSYVAKQRCRKVMQSLARLCVGKVSLRNARAKQCLVRHSKGTALLGTAEHWHGHTELSNAQRRQWRGPAWYRLARVLQGDAEQWQSEVLLDPVCNGVAMLGRAMFRNA